MVLVTLSSLALLVVAIVHDDEKRAILRVAEAVLAHPMALALVFLGCSIMPVFLRFSAYHWHLRCIDRTTNEVETGKQQQRSSSSPSSSSSPIPSYQATSAPAAPAPSGIQQARPIDDLPVLQRHHSFAQHGLGGFMNWHDVCCGEVVPSRLGDGTRYRSTHDFLVAHVDPKQYPALFELHMASSNLLLTAQATEQTREGITASAAGAATDMVTLVDEDDLQYSPSISSNSKRSWSERASPFGSQHNSFVVARSGSGGVQPAANGNGGTTSAVGMHGHSLEGDYDPSRLYPVRSFYISTDDSSV